MGSLKRFEEFRFVGVRDRMRFYDSEDPDQAAELATAVEERDLFGRNLLQTFAPDTEPEARNRGFRPARI